MTTFTTGEGIPLIRNPHGRTLDPRRSRTLGLVLVRGIDPRRGELQILTPLPDDVVAVAAADQNLVLVAGKFDTPNWAYAEDLYLGNAPSALTAAAATSTNNNNGRGLSSNDGEDGGMEIETDDQYLGAEAEVVDIGPSTSGDQHVGGVPWVEMLHGNQKRSVGSKVWRVRRDLGRN